MAVPRRAERAGAEIARAGEHGFGVVVADISRDVTFAVIGVGAQDDGARRIGAVPDAFLRFEISRRRNRCAIGGIVVVRLRDAVLPVYLDAFEILAHHEVDDAGQGVRSVHGRGATRQDFDVVHE